MVTYIYFVKCPDCEDEHFDFFDEAKEFALGCLTKKPIITQTEVTRNDFGECTDHCDLGTVWSWEDMMQDTISEDDATIFSKNETFGISEGLDDFDDFDIGPQIDEFDYSLDFDITGAEAAIDFLVTDEEEAIAGYEEVEDAIEDLNVENKKEILDTLDHIKEEEEEHIKELEALLDLDKTERKSIPANMTIEQLVETMEENEDEVECACCNDLFDKSVCHKEADFGWLCPSCEAAIKSRGETLSIQTNESFSSKETVDFDYGDLEVTLQGRKRDVDDWDERAVLVDYTYEVSKDDVATTIWENFITDEDVLDVPGGLEALENDTAWSNFLETHFDSLVDKYYNQLLDYYRDYAAEEYEENNSLEDYDYNAECNYYDSMREKFDPEVKHDLGNDYDGGYPTDSTEIDEVSGSQLSLCPECGKETFDLETGICIECGFN